MSNVDLILEGLPVKGVLKEDKVWKDFMDAYAKVGNDLKTRADKDKTRKDYELMVDLYEKLPDEDIDDEFIYHYSKLVDHAKMYLN